MDDMLAGYKNANDLCIQLISLATGILVLSITFINDVLKRNPPTWPLKISWGCFLISIVFGIGMMMAVTGTIFQITADKEVARALMYKSDPEKLKAMMAETEADPEKVKAAMDEAVNTLTAAAIYKFNIKVTSGLQILTFLAGILFLMVFGARAMIGGTQKAAEAAPPRRKKSTRSLRRS